MGQVTYSTLAMVGYLAVFGATAVACFASAIRMSQINDRETRDGLTALLLTSGGWAVTHVAFLLTASPPLQRLFYLVGLILGLASVGPWLYFCSAYTNRSLHRNTTYRRIAVGVFLALVAVKATNPFHHLYFTAELVSTPFTHLAVTHQPFHWLVMGLSYALALIGAFMLFEHFTQVNYDTKPLLGLVGITGLPVGLDIVGLTTPYLIDITYEPIGVAVFAVGVGFVYRDQFQTIQVAGSHDVPIIVVSNSDRIRDYNQPARELFPELEDTGAIGEPLWATVPEVADALEREPSIIERTQQGETRYYRVSESPFSARGASLGRLLSFADITDRERYRRELERQNERLEEFASMVSHDLRNPLNVAMVRIQLARDEFDSEHLETAENALDRMETLIADVLALARHGQPIDDAKTVSLSAVASQSWEMIDGADGELVIEGDLQFVADRTRLQQLLENLFRNAVEHGSADVTIRVGPLSDRAGFYVADDGEGIPPDQRDDVFETGYSTAENGTGFGLAIVAEIVDAHGWSIAITESERGGVSIEITGVQQP
jgi:signal transduction histidine kinase